MGVYFSQPLSALTDTWRIFYEAAADLNPRDERSDYEELRGNYGARIYRQGQDTLAVSTESRRVYNRLRRDIPGLQVKTGCVLLFPDALLDTVAEAINARRKRQVSEEEKGRLRTLSQQYSPFVVREGTETCPSPSKVGG